MRLIDKDVLEMLLRSKRYSKRSMDLIDSIPVVDAIPIEWIKDYIIPFQVHHDSLSKELQENDGAGWVVDVLETMLKEWEKENEGNRR